VVAQPAPPAKTGSLPSPAPTILSLSQRIGRAVEQTLAEPSSRDIFQVPLAWIGSQKIGQDIAAPAQRRPRFDETHHLSAIILSGDRSGALIDGMMIKVGESIDGYRLASVSNNLAVFESATERAFVRVEKSAIAATGN